MFSLTAVAHPMKLRLDPRDSAKLSLSDDQVDWDVALTGLQLGDNASAIIVAKPTGEQFTNPLPKERGGTSTSAPTTYVKVEVRRVLSGSLDATTIDLVSPGTDERTGEPALLKGGPVILFVTPAMYAAAAPAGGYVVVGGPTGIYAQSGKAFLRVDTESPKMPASVTLESTTWPEITLSEQALLHRGPR